ncbi:hypothetical protein SAMN05443637_1215 [Pseudonocardia thermophila]|uniref:Peptidase_C39 like family protein n=2 Tax=Pseudonocardia thermophila TaxID=1848 RepID=A0A1M6YQV7_PSETH|nr:hypothetical protein SAMN05443637_1215 [Pseudonocardia thermophila]
MQTVCGMARSVQRLVVRRRPAAPPVPPVRLLAVGRRPLVTDKLGPQRYAGATLDQVDSTTCGSAVLVAIAAWAEPAELERLEGTGRAVAGSGLSAATATSAVGFGARYDVRQLQVHRESTRFWPAALGTSPWGMVAWLRRHAPAAGPYRVRLVDDTSAADLGEAIESVDRALAAGRPVPLLVGTFIPRHYVMAVGAGPAGWRVYEPTSGEVREVPRDAVRAHATRRLLGFDRLHALLLPV